MYNLGPPVLDFPNMAFSGGLSAALTNKKEGQMLNLGPK